MREVGREWDMGGEKREKNGIGVERRGKRKDRGGEKREQKGIGLE